MSMLRKEGTIAVRFTLLTTVILGLFYPLAVTGIGQFFFPRQANGSLLVDQGQVIGSAWIEQGFRGDRYFHGRPSAAGNGYDATASGASNLAPSSQKLIARIADDVKGYGAPKEGVPVDLVTASGSGLDPEISPAAAMFQAKKVASARGLPLAAVEEAVRRHVQGRQFGLLGEERVNVLLLNLDLDGKR
jgi:potassium-transporting ATPase KdpC subunit